MKRPRDEQRRTNGSVVAVAPTTSGGATIMPTVCRSSNNNNKARCSRVLQNLVVISLLLLSSTSTAKAIETTSKTPPEHENTLSLEDDRRDLMQQQQRHRDNSRQRGGTLTRHRNYHKRQNSATGSTSQVNRQYYDSPQRSASNTDDQFYRRRYRRYRNRGNKNRYPTQIYTSLKDVWFCLFMALGWTVWMLSSLVRSDWVRYQKDSVLVRGHVLEVSVDHDSLGTGIPTYKAVIDYMIDYTPPHHAISPDHTNMDNTTNQTIQVRKRFETQHLLQQGFSNVELLVLPQEPTHSILREDYEQQVLDQTKQGADGVTMRQGSVLCKRLSVAFAALLVLVSLAGCVTVVTKLDPVMRWKGWVVLCTGVALLLPTGLVVQKLVTGLQRQLDFQSSKAGVILRGATSTMRNFWDIDLDALDPGLCDDEEQQHATTPTSLQRRQQMMSNYQLQSQLSGDGNTAAGSGAGGAGPGCYFIQLPGGPPRGGGGRRYRASPTRRTPNPTPTSLVSPNVAVAGVAAASSHEQQEHHDDDHHESGSSCSNKTSSTISSLSAPTSLGGSGGLGGSGSNGGGGGGAANTAAAAMAAAVSNVGDLLSQTKQSAAGLL